MKIDITKLPKSEIELKIEVPTEEWQEFLDRAAKELSKDLKVEGFRPGFVPLKLVEEKIGIAKILEEAAEDCVKKCYVKAILENNIEAIGQPEISILKLAKGNPFEFKARVAVMPEVKLPDYKKIASEIKRNKILVEEKEIEETLSWLQKSRARFSQKLGPCRKGDWIEIEYSSPQIENGKKTKDAFILGEGHLIPGFEENLEGMEFGQEKEFSLTFPKNHLQKDLAGREINFKVELKSVQNMELPEINDEFARQLGNFEDLESLKKSLKEGINMEKEIAESERVRQIILEKIAEKSEMEIPDVLINSVKTQMLADLKQNISQKLGISFEDYLAKVGKTENDLMVLFSEQARKRVKNSLVLREISKKEKIEASDEEVEMEANKILKNLTMEKAQELDPEKLKSYTEDVIINEKTLQLLENFTKTL
jgi:trigger factor